ncbi:hypothetical protein [Romboutsia lituseburensis]|uniref:hypothetical protein n=1 Tax=Romboutsia lituseburensis TaxID=1537 RepID=UPI00215A7DAA|nr:hypothetical protein [Romboutsia lituseburensis]MCR8743937.1 hypothetical protein [Romboutsia lituseburensis]
MLDQINIQINNAKNEVAKKYVLENKLNGLKLELKTAEEELTNLENNLRKEKKDVDNLKKLSLSNLIYTVAGNKADKMEKEEKEYVMAKLQYDKCQSNVNLIKSNISNITSRLNDLSKYEAIYANLLKKKIELINVYGDESTKNKIIYIEKNIDMYIKEMKEVDESIYVGNELLDEVRVAKKLLASAKAWSTFDIFGGDLLSYMAKHSKIDDVQWHLSKISNLIKSFNKELKDVNISGINFSSSTKTFDIFFDNIFTDLSVDKHITDSYDNICILEVKVENILKRLKNNRNDLNDIIESKKNEYDEFVKNI